MNIMGIIFANIYDSSLGELTNKRTIASLPYGGRYRQIDFSLSNMSNSGISHIGIITKYNYQSLMAHIGSGQEWDLELGVGGLEFLTPFAMGYSGSYRGKLEAINSAMDFLDRSDEEYIVLADSGVLCSIDFRTVVENHIASGCDLTVVTKRGIANGKKQLDLAVKVDEHGEITDMAVDYCASADYEASMGIFVLRRELLMEAAREATARSRYRLERDFLLRSFNKGKLSVHLYPFDGIALFNESPREYYANNLALLEAPVRRSLFHNDWSIYTSARATMPAYFGKTAQLNNAIVGDGCRIHGCVERSVLFRNVHVEAGAVIRNCVIMHDCSVAAGAYIECVVLDKGIHVRPGARLIGTPEHPVIVSKGDIL